jgi:membrane protease YdiL (CAAX protease family)
VPLTTAHPAAYRWRGAVRAVILLAGFALAVALRVLIGRGAAAQSPAAGLAFGTCLLALAVAARVTVPVTARSVGLGVLGAVVLIAPVVVVHHGRPLHGWIGFASWALVVAFVAAAEELFLRGALYDAVTAAAGSTAAIAAGAIAFALLHVPLYGWHALALDLIVGLLLGELRRTAQTPVSPAISHVLADLVAWFLR